MKSNSKAMTVAIIALLFSCSAMGGEVEAISFVTIGDEYFVSLAPGELNLGKKTKNMPLRVKVLKHGGGSWYRVRLLFGEKWQPEFWLNFDHVVTVQDADSSTD